MPVFAAFRHEPQGYRVDAVTDVLQCVKLSYKDVVQVCATICAHDLCTVHPETAVFNSLHRTLDLLIKARPSAANIELWTNSITTSRAIAPLSRRHHPHRFRVEGNVQVCIQAGLRILPMDDGEDECINAPQLPRLLEENKDDQQESRKNFDICHSELTA